METAFASEGARLVPGSPQKRGHDRPAGAGGARDPAADGEGAGSPRRGGKMGGVVIGSTGVRRKAGQQGNSGAAIPMETAAPARGVDPPAHRAGERRPSPGAASSGSNRASPGKSPARRGAGGAGAGGPARGAPVTALDVQRRIEELLEQRDAARREERAHDAAAAAAASAAAERGGAPRSGRGGSARDGRSPQSSKSPSSPATRSVGGSSCASAPRRKTGLSILASLPAIEDEMRSCLAGLASHEEDEVIVMMRQFRREEAAAAARGSKETAPGCVSVLQFQQAWRKLGVRVGAEQCCALFLRHGCDEQGMLDYAAFTRRLLGAPGEGAAAETEQRGPYQLGRAATFRGRITYHPCRTPVWPPSNWDGSLAGRSGRLPKAGLALEWAYGYSGRGSTCQNAFYTAQGRVVYPVAGVGVVYDPREHSQAFFRGHDDVIRCLALHPDKTLAATGQGSSTERGGRACVCVWNTAAVPPAQVVRINLPAGPGVAAPASSLGVVALAFSPGGAYLATVAGDDKHTVSVFRWRSRTLVAQGVGHNGAPLQVYGVTFNPYHGEDASPSPSPYTSPRLAAAPPSPPAAAPHASAGGGGEEGRPLMFATWGVKHVKFWARAWDEAGREYYSTAQGRWPSPEQRADVTSAAFLRGGWLVTGGGGGQLMQWDASYARGALGRCVRVIEAHAMARSPRSHAGDGPAMAVRALALRCGGRELVSAGDDGRLVAWEVTGEGGLGRATASLQFEDPAEPDPTSFRALDFAPAAAAAAAPTPDGGGAASPPPGRGSEGAPAILVGTPCDLWEIPGGALALGPASQTPPHPAWGSPPRGGGGAAAAGAGAAPLVVAELQGRTTSDEAASCARRLVAGSTSAGGGGGSGGGGAQHGGFEGAWAAAAAAAGGGGGGTGCGRRTLSDSDAPSLAPRPLVQGHMADASAVAWHPTRPHKFATATACANVYVWHARRRGLIAKVTIGLPALCLAFSPDGRHLAVGTAAGVVRVLDAGELSAVVAELDEGPEAVEVLSYSPDGAHLAVAGRGGGVALYAMASGSYRRVARCSVAAAAAPPPRAPAPPPALDWSSDSGLLRVCGSGRDLAVYEAGTGRRVQRNTRNEAWATHTSTLGFGVMGLWREGDAGDEVAAVDRSGSSEAQRGSDPLAQGGPDGGPLVAAACRDGGVRLFNFPCVVEGAPCRDYRGHAREVAALRFSPHNRWLVSAGQRDRALLQWRVMSDARQAPPQGPPGRGAGLEPEAYVLYDDDAEGRGWGRGGRARTGGHGGGEEEDDDDGEVFVEDGAAAAPRLAPRALRHAGAPHAPSGAPPEPLAAWRARQAAEAAWRAEEAAWAEGRRTKGGARRGAGGAAGGDADGEGSGSASERGSGSASDSEPASDGGWASEGRGEQAAEAAQEVRARPAPRSPPRGLPKLRLTAAAAAGGRRRSPRRARARAAAGSSAPSSDASASPFVSGGGGGEAAAAAAPPQDDASRAAAAAAAAMAAAAAATAAAAAARSAAEVACGGVRERCAADGAGGGPAADADAGTSHREGGATAGDGVPADEAHGGAADAPAGGGGGGEESASSYGGGSSGRGDEYRVDPPICRFSGAGEERVAYEISTLTSDMRGAGTDCGVFAVLYGSTGDSGEVALDNHPDNFGRGRLDTFVVWAPQDLGQLLRLRIGHDGRGARPRWHLAGAKAVRRGSGEPPATFPCGMWFARDEGDGQTTRVLLRGRGTAGAGAGAPGAPPTGMRSVGYECYRVTVRTSDLKGAGTDAAVALTLVGSAGASGPHPLENDGRCFRRGGIDEFEMVAAVGELRAIRIGHDGAGPDPAWHLQARGAARRGGARRGGAQHGAGGLRRGGGAAWARRWPSTRCAARLLSSLLLNTGMPTHARTLQEVAVSRPGAPRLRFPAARWLAADEEDGQTWATLTPGAEGAAAARQASWDRLRAASLSASLELPPSGGAGSSAAPSPRDAAAAADADAAAVPAAGGGAWPEVGLGEEGPTEVLRQAPSSPHSLALPKGDLVPQVVSNKYKLSIQTLDSRGAGTSAAVAVSLVGDRGASRDIPLERGHDSFGRGKLWPGRAGGAAPPRTAGYRVAVRSAAARAPGGAEWAPPAAGEDGDPRALPLTLTLFGTGAAAPGEGAVRTINSGPRRAAVGAGALVPGGVAAFTFRGRDLGDITGATLSLEAPPPGSPAPASWLLEGIEVTDLGRGTVTLFPWGRWLEVPLDSKAPPLQQVLLPAVVGGGSGGGAAPDAAPGAPGADAAAPGLGVAGVGLLRYEVAVLTSDYKDAGTDGRVWVLLEGAKGRSGWTRLEASADNFERGCRDVFTLVAPDLGPIREVAVRKEGGAPGGAGAGAAGGAAGAGGAAARDWHLHSVEVLHPGLQRRFVFPAHRWLRGASCEAALSAIQPLPTPGPAPGPPGASPRTPASAAASPAPASAADAFAGGGAGPQPYSPGGGVFGGDPAPLSPAAGAPLPLLTAPHALSGGGGGGAAAPASPTAAAAGHSPGVVADPRLPVVYRAIVIRTAGAEGGEYGTGGGAGVVDSALGDVAVVVYGEAGNTGELRLEGGEEAALEGGTEGVTGFRGTSFLLRARDVGLPASVRFTHRPRPGRAGAAAAGCAPWDLVAFEVIHELTGEGVRFELPETGWQDAAGAGSSGGGAGGALAAPRTALLLPVAFEDEDEEEGEGDEYEEGEEGGEGGGAAASDGAAAALGGAAGGGEPASPAARGGGAPPEAAAARGVLAGDGGESPGGDDRARARAIGLARAAEFVRRAQEDAAGTLERGLDEATAAAGAAGGGDAGGSAGGGAPPATYQITVVTRPPPPGAESAGGGGADAEGGAEGGASDDVSISLLGTRGHTGPLRLAVARRGRGGGGGGVETFLVEGPDVGVLTSANLELHTGEVEGAWQVESVEVAHTGTGQSMRFAFVGWFDSDDPGMALSSHPLPLAADEAAAASAASAESPRRRGAPSGSDGGGDSGGEAAAEAEALAYAGAGAAAAAAAGGAMAGDGGDAAEGPCDRVVEYEVAVSTSDVAGAGTECEVYLSLSGERGEVGEVRLQRSCAVGTIDKHGRSRTRAALFGRGATDLFSFAGPDVGGLRAATVRTVERGLLGTAWHLDRVLVRYGPATIAKFKYSGWLRRTSAPGGDAVTLVEEGLLADAAAAAEARGAAEAAAAAATPRAATTPGGSGGGDEGARQLQLETEEREAADAEAEGATGQLGAEGQLAGGEEEEEDEGGAAAEVDMWWQEPEAVVRYKVSVATSNVVVAGTLAPILVQVIGPLGLLGQGAIILENGAKRFERDCLDEFWLELPASTDCGAPIQRLVVERGGGPDRALDWHMDHIEVADMDRGLTYKWCCVEWFSARDGLRKEWDAGLQPGPGAPTDQALRLVEAPGPDALAAAARAAAPSSAGGSASGGGGGSGGGGAQPPSARAVRRVASTFLGRPQHGYHLRVITGDKIGSGTSARVHLLLEGAGATGAPTAWQPPLPAPRGGFQRGGADEFTLTAPTDLGALTGGRAWLEGGLGATWNLARLEVNHLPSRRAWALAPARGGGWVPRGRGPEDGLPLAAEELPGGGGGDKRGPTPPRGPSPLAGAGPPAPDGAAPPPLDAAPLRQLSPPPPPAAAAPAEYELTVVTGDRLGAGTAAAVSLALTGTRRSCSHSLPTGRAGGAARRLFDRAAVDGFSMTMPELGGLLSLRVWIEAGGDGGDAGDSGRGAGVPGMRSAWYLSRIEVVHKASGCRWEFEFETWVRGGRDKAATAAARLVAGVPPAEWREPAAPAAQLAAAPARPPSADEAAGGEGRGARSWRPWGKAGSSGGAGGADPWGGTAFAAGGGD
ncbi:MAG: hypothetical protein J3K34DRAFT_500007 [Monoraphidium minutum]|nr:MAG: hypothetical protein J3K34DRAFT_500007 [Monoraphidium minutum]